MRLLDREAPEDAIVTSMRLPRVFEVSFDLMTGGVIAVAVFGSVLIADGDDRVNLSLAALLVAPWLAWLTRGCPPVERVAPWVLAPAALVAVVDAASPDRPLGFAPQFLLYLCLLGLVGCVFAPRRVALSVVVATYAVFTVRGLVGPEPGAGMVNWLLALSFCVAAVFGLRTGAVVMTSAQLAAAEREDHDERSRIARRVNDIAARTLAALLTHLGTARAALSRATTADAVTALEDAEHEGRASLADLRRIVRLLRAADDAPTRPTPEAPRPDPAAPDAKPSDGPAGGGDLLAAVEVPDGIAWATRHLALAVGVLAVTGTAVVDPDELAATAVLIGAMLLPWAIEVAGFTLPQVLFVAMVLTPPAVEVAAGATEPLGFGGSSSIYLAMVLLLTMALGPVRPLVATAAAALAVYGARGVLDGDPYAMTTWAFALLFTLAGCVGIRVAVLNIARAQRATVARDAADRRRQVARDVHDVAAHSLAVTMLHVTAARMALLRADLEGAREALDQAERSGRSSLGDVAGLVGQLQAGADGPGLDRPGPTLAELPALVDGYRTAGLAVEGGIAGGLLDHVPAAVGHAAYRVVQEALSNAARHGAGSATLQVKVTPAVVVVDIRNPRCTEGPPETGGSGTRGMRERVEAAGGTIAVGPTGCGRSWHLHAELPANPAAPASRQAAPA